MLDIREGSRFHRAIGDAGSDVDAREIRIALREARPRIEYQIIKRFHSPSPECTDGRVTDICVTFNRITDFVSGIQAVFSVLFSSVSALGVLGLAPSRSTKKMIRDVTGVTRRHQEEQAERVLAEADCRPISKQVLEDSMQDVLDLFDDAGYCDDTRKKRCCIGRFVDHDGGEAGHRRI